jgi:hypothetical protein
MSKEDREMWRINIENSTDTVNKIYGPKVATSVFHRYGATSFDNLSPSYYWEVFSDLELIANDK